MRSTFINLQQYRVNHHRENDTLAGSLWPSSMSQIRYNAVEFEGFINRHTFEFSILGIPQQAISFEDFVVKESIHLMDPVRTTISQVLTSILQYILTWLRVARTGSIKMYWFFYYRVFKWNGLLWSFGNGESEGVSIDEPFEFDSVVTCLTHTRRS
jgi:hypothetical protein